MLDLYHFHIPLLILLLKSASLTCQRQKIFF